MELLHSADDDPALLSVAFGPLSGALWPYVMVEGGFVPLIFQRTDRLLTIFFIGGTKVYCVGGIVFGVS